jgi:hypothetical protein
MVPVRWMSYEVMPKNANGKIDRPRLKERFFQAELEQSVREAAPATATTSSLRRPEAAADGTEALCK